MILHEAKNNHWDSEAEFLPMEMLALTPLTPDESFPDAGENAEGGVFPIPFFAFGDGDEDDMEEDDFDDMEEDDFDDDEDEDEEDDFDDDEDEDDDDDEEEDDFEEDEDDFDYDEDDDFEYSEE